MTGPPGCRGASPCARRSRPRGSGPPRGGRPTVSRARIGFRPRFLIGQHCWANAPASGEIGGYSLYHSADGGATWREVRGHGLPADTGAACEYSDALNVLVSPFDARVLYLDAGSPNPDVGPDLYRSDDGGARWTPLRPRYATGGGNAPDGMLRFDPWHPGRLYMEGDEVLSIPVYVSGDGGKTWGKMPHLPSDAWRVVADPTSPLIYYAPGANGVYRSVDGGRTWRDWTNGALAGRVSYQDNEQIVNFQVALVR